MIIMSQTGAAVTNSVFVIPSKSDLSPENGLCLGKGILIPLKLLGLFSLHSLLCGVVECSISWIGCLLHYK